MTPLQLLEEVKGRFLILYHADEAALQRLLRQALGKFQEKAGVILRCETSEIILPVPELCASVASCHDANSRFIPVNTDVEDCVLHLETSINNRPPYTILYFANLRDWTLERPLPGECIGLISDYLEALIAVPNTDRDRRHLLYTGVNPSDLPSVQDLKARIAEVELQMEDAKAIVPPLMLY